MKSCIRQRAALCCFSHLCLFCFDSNLREWGLIMFKSLCVLTDVDPDPRPAPHLSLSPSPRGDRLDAASFSIKAPETKKQPHKTLLITALSARLQTQTPAITGNTPSSACQSVPSWDRDSVGFTPGGEPQGGQSERNC